MRRFLPVIVLAVSFTSMCLVFILVFPTRTDEKEEKQEEKKVLPPEAGKVEFYKPECIFEVEEIYPNQIGVTVAVRVLNRQEGSRAYVYVARAPHGGYKKGDIVEVLEVTYKDRKTNEECKVLFVP